MQLAPGSRLDHFEILARLGQGGIGTVFRAHDTELDRDVALKVLREDLSTDPMRLDRFKREARAASALNHPNIVTIHEIGSFGSRLYLVMELVNGRTLREVMKRDRLPFREIVALGAQIAEGLAVAHAAGIVHRDLKPENVMVNDDGLVKILDFGLAKLVRTGESVGEDQPTEGQLTRPGVVMGTVNYMSPEQVSGKPVDGRSDQFALGTILYEMAARAHPFEKGTPLHTMNVILEGEATPLRELCPDLPGALCALVTRLLAKTPGERYKETSEVVAALRGRLDTEARRPVAATGLPWFLKTLSTDEEKERPLFVGRDEEIGRLSERLEKAIAGDGQIVFVTGEPGSGKTTLLQEFARRAGARDERLVPVFGNCDAQTGLGDPYLPFRQILGLLTGDLEAPRAASAMSLDQALRLWALFPRAVRAIMKNGSDLIGTLLPGDALLSRSRALALDREERKALEGVVELRSKAGLESGLQQPTIFGQCTRLLAELSRETPLVLILEDLHWADAGTVGLLLQLCRRLRGARILVVGTFRTEDISSRGDERHPLESAVRELTSQLGELELPVGVSGGRRFVDSVVDARPNRLAADFREALFRHTEGHALFTIELLRELIDKQVLRKDSDGAYVAPEQIDWNALPVRVEAVVAERIRRLPKPLQRVLTLASVEGDEFTAEVVARVEGVDEKEIVGLLSEELDKAHHLVHARGVERSGGQRLSRYRFRHILFQRYLYQQLDDVERSYVHEEVGTVLEELLGPRADEWAPHLARHFKEGGVREKAFHYLACSADRARRAYASPEARRLYTEALAEGSALTEGRDPERLLLHEGRGQVGMMLAKYGDAIADFTEMRRLAQATNDASKEALSLNLLAVAHVLKQSREDERLAERYAREALELARKIGASTIIARSLATLGLARQSLGDLDEADQKLGEAMEISRREGFEFNMAQSAAFLAHQAYWRADFRRAIELGEEGVRVSAEIRDGFYEYLTEAALCLSYWGNGEFARAMEMARKGSREAMERGNVFAAGRLINSFGLFYMDFGDASRALEFHEQSLEIGRDKKILNVEVSSLIDIGLDYFLLGQSEKALSYFVPTFERVEREGHGSHRWRWTVRLLESLAEVHFARGDDTKGLRFADAALEKARATTSRKYVAKAHALQGHIAAKLGDARAAGENFEAAFALAKKLSSPSILYPIAHDFVVWCMESGQEEKARELHRLAKETVDRMTRTAPNESMRESFQRLERVQRILLGA